MEFLLTTRELADALGVSESSIKRWADTGTIRATRTVGGHRRIALPEAIRFIRASRAALVRPELLRLGDVAAVVRDVPPPGEASDQLFEYLREGSSRHARGLVQSLYLAGESVAAILDDVVAVAMGRIGELWPKGPEGILVEHRATDICVQALNQLGAMLPGAAEGPVAVGGAPHADPYALPSLAAATALAAEGYRTVNLGPDTPFALLQDAIRRLDPRLLWVSVSAAPPQPERLADEIVALARAVRPAGVSVIVGGRALSEFRHEEESNLTVGRTMAELVAFARGLRAAGAE